MRNASSIVSFATIMASGVSSGAARFSRSSSGYGCSHGTETGGEPSGAVSFGRGYLARKSRHAFVAILYSHARTGASPRNVARPVHARRNVSWVRSWDSSNEPSIR